ncbi:MAG TPA: 4Fe-4S dicluster domain-containing protein [Acidobacteriaceae bacterium]|nr:4Fe-4S dicluster domain-containing protein [Acidobacteriaceae bacterium]
MASREMELSGLTQTNDPPRGLLAEVAERLIYPFQHGKPPEPQQATGFYTDTTVCIGCKACEVACKQWNQLPSDGFNWSGNSYDNTAELSATTWRHVKFVEQFSAEGSASEDVVSPESPFSRWLMMSDHCKHCLAAPCHQACPTGAIIQNEFENVYIQADICNGCSSCVAACPFGVITRSDMGGHSHKCTLCYDRQRDGLEPACAKACPTQSIHFGPVEELRERARQRVEELHQRGLAQAYLYGDVPTETYSEMHSFYLLVDRPSVYGLPEAPFNPWLHMMGDYVRSVTGGLAAIAVLLAVVFLMKP